MSVRAGGDPVLALLRVRLSMLVNAGWRSGPARRLWSILLVLVATVVVLGGYRVAASAFAVAPPDPADVPPVVAAALAALASFAGITSVTFALGALYQARDLDLLLAAPIRPRAILLSRLLAQVGTGAAIAALAAGGPVVAYLRAAGDLAAAPALALAGLAVAALPVAAGTALTVWVVRVLPPRRIRQAGPVLVTLTGFAAVLMTLAVRGPAGVVTARGPGFAVHSSAPALSAWLPTGWAARSVGAALTGDAATCLAWLAPLLVTAAAALLLVSAGCEGAYLRGLRGSIEAGTAGRPRRRSAPPVAARGRRPWVAVAWKDVLELRRDPGQLAQMVVPVALFAAYVAIPGGAAAGAGGGRLPPWFGAALTAGFAALFASSGVALRGVGAEGARLWLLRVAPIQVRDLLRAKAAVGCLVAIPSGLALLWVAGLRAGVDAAALAGPSLLLVVQVAGLVALAVGMGAARPRLDWTDPRRAVGLGLSFAFLAAGGLFLTASFALLALPYAAGPLHLAAPASAAGAVGLATVVGAVALRAGARRLAGLDL